MINQFFHTVRLHGRVWLAYAGALFIIQVALTGVFNQAGWLTLNTAALILAMSGLGYLCSALSQRGSQAVGWAGGLIAAMFFLDWFATLWDKVAFFTPLSLFHYHKPHQVLYGTANWQVNIAVLLVVAALTFAAATVAFEKRDLTR